MAGESVSIIRILGRDEASVLDRTASDVFDHAIHKDLAEEFLADARHHLAVALVDEQVVGMASAVHYVHPDKPPELWVNEVGVAPEHRNRGLGRKLLEALFERGWALGCRAAWVATERSNIAARRLYASVGGEEEAEETVIVSFILNPTDQRMES